MSDVIEGGCRCSRFRYQARVHQLPPVYACHCRDCQTWSGSAFSLQIILLEGCLTVSGQTSIFELASADGARISSHHACPVCFTRIFNTNTGRPGMAVVRAGTLDRSDELSIVAHIWTRRKLSGISIPAGIPVWLQSAPPADLAQLLKTA
jgi:hypothetical protein